MSQALGQALHDQQAGGIPALRGMLRYQLWREIVVEFGRSHGRCLPVFRRQCDSFAVKPRLANRLANFVVIPISLTK